jgi:glycine cleavage system H protein
MSSLRYAKSHEWVRLDGDIATVGISVFAQEQLGDVVYVDLPEPGKTLTKGGEAAVVESVKAASEVYAPLSGTVVSVNADVSDNPALINEDATGKGWFFTMKIGNPAELDELMDEATYLAQAEGH